MRFTHPTRSVSAAADGLAGLEVAGFAFEVESVAAGGDFDELLGVGVVFFGEDFGGFVFLVANRDFVTGGNADAILADEGTGAAGTEAHLIAAGGVGFAVGNAACVGDELQAGTLDGLAVEGYGAGNIGEGRAGLAGAAEEQGQKE